jgi:chemotaxis protein MotB
MAEHGHEFIIVKRHEEEEHEAHSSAWKVAHADFMTAMMAFFLNMWLINATDDKVRRGISQYFNPIHMSDGQSGMKGLAKPGESVEKENGVKQGGKGNNKKDEFNPLKLSPGASSEKDAEPGAASAAAEGIGSGAAANGSAQGASAAAGANPGGKGSGGGIISAEGHVGAGSAPASTGEGEGAAPSSKGEVEGVAAKGEIGGGTGTYGGTGAGDFAALGDASERAAFQDPYAVLAKLAAQYSADHSTSSAVVVGDDRKPGLAGGEVDRDPFDPVYWQLAATPSAKTDVPGKPGTSAAVPDGAIPDAGAMAAHPDEAGPGGGLDKGKPPGPLPDVALRPTKLEEAPPAPAAAPPPMQEAAKVAMAKAEPEPVAAAGPPGLDAGVVKAAEAVRAAIAKSVAPTVAADAGSPAISVVPTSEGVAIDLSDAADFIMFDVGSAVPKGKVVVLMEKVAKVLADRPGEIIIRGHTDGRPFHSGQYDNWRLSAARAHMAYYMLTRGGLPESRVIRIEGAADRDLKNKADPMAAENRRIEILLVAPKP